MSRVRSAVAAACLAALLQALLPAPASALRESRSVPAVVASEPMGERLVGTVLVWGRAALSWFQAIIAAEHGTVVQTPVVTPPAP